MGWTLRSALEPELYVTYSEEGWSADPQTTTALDQAGGPFGDALLSPVGPVHVSDGDGDEVALFINAVGLLLGVATLDEGSEPPVLPELPELPEGAVA